MIKADGRIWPEACGAECHTLIIVQVDYVDGVDVGAARAVSSRQVACGAVYVTNSALMLCVVFVLTVRTLCRAHCCPVLQEIRSPIISAAGVARVSVII